MQGKWVLESVTHSFEAPVKETLQFHSDGTFINVWYLDSVILPYAAADSTRVTLSGRWIVKDNDLLFINQNLSIPNAIGQDSIVSSIQFITKSESFGKTVLSRWGHTISTGTTINDTLEVKIGYEYDLGNPNVVIPDTTGCIITELTEKKLVVWSYNNQTRTYYNE